MDVSWMFHGCFMDVSWMFHGCFMDVSWCFTTSLVSWVFCRWRFQNLVGPVMSCPGPKPEWGCRWPRHRHELVLASRRTNPRKVRRLQETSGDFRRLQETSGDFGFILWRKKRNEKGNIEFTWIYDELQSVIHIEALQSDSWSVQIVSIVSIVSSFENFELFRPNPGACSSKPQVKRWSQIMGLQSQPVARPKALRIIKYNKFIKW